MKGPVRLQISRKKGFRLQDASVAVNGLPAIIVARPSRDGNPFVVGLNGVPDRKEAVRLYREMLERECATDPQAAELRFHRLRGKNLACWCELPKPGEPDICHAAVLLELANRQGTPPDPLKAK